jgi:hypothetical protein
MQASSVRVVGNAALLWKGFGDRHVVHGRDAFAEGPEYFGGWVISAALTLATVLVVSHFRI